MHAGRRQLTAQSGWLVGIGGGAGSVSSVGWVDHWVQVMELKGIHLALEVKTSFGSSMPVMGSSMESSTFGIAGKKRRKTCTQKVKSKA
jgi:hypothetical protein